MYKQNLTDWLSRLRADEVSDEEVARAIESVPAHFQYLLSGTANLSVADKSFSNTVNVDAEKLAPLAATLPIAWQGTLSTRSSNTVGILTMASGSHLITTAAVVDFFWQDVNGNQQFIHNVTVGTVAGVSVPFTVPTDAVFAEPDLPPLNTVMQVAIVQVFTLPITGDNVVALLATCDNAAAQMMLIDVVPVENLQLLLPAKSAYQWIGVGPNPLAGVSPITLWMSHNSTTTPRECRVTAMLSS